MGSRDGDVGRDGAGLTVDVLELPPDNLAWDRLPDMLPVPLRYAVGGPVLRDGECALLDRKEVGAVGLESLLCALRSRAGSLTGVGAGEFASSMISTQPESPLSLFKSRFASLFACFSKLSLLFRGSGLGRPESMLVFAVE